MIKNVLFAICVFLISILNVDAQQLNYVGVKGGISIPSLQAGESKNIWNKDYKSRVGPSFGLVAEFSLAEHWSLIGELSFAGQGGKRNNIQPMTIPAQYDSAFKKAFNTDKNYIFANLNNTSRINYLQIPIMLRYQTSILPKLDVYAQAGIFVGYMLSAKQIVNSDSLRVFLDEEGTKEIPGMLVGAFFGSSVDTTIDAYQDLYHFNYGFQGGLGLSYKIGKGKLFVEGGGNYGLQYIQKGDEHGKNRIGAGLVVLGYAIKIND